MPDRHPGHVPEQIVDGLDLKADAVDHIKKQTRYAARGGTPRFNTAIGRCTLVAWTYVSSPPSR
jgi:hypothetical protein